MSQAGYIQIINPERDDQYDVLYPGQALYITVAVDEQMRLRPPEPRAGQYGGWVNPRAWRLALALRRLREA